MNDERRGGERWNKNQGARDIPVMIGGRLAEIVGETVGDSVGFVVVGPLDGPRLGDTVGDSVGSVVGSVDGPILGKIVGDSVGDLVGDSVGSLDGPTVGTGEGTGVGTDVVKHWDAPMNIFCVAVNRVLTSAAVSTLLYMRKSLMPPFKYASALQWLFPKKLMGLDMDRGYGFDAVTT
eukprot:gene62033-biopygen40087